ncbi:hypothetical protein QBC32DRAFT_316812 [Pseudoneurospora amorphoporcata]|uniref:Uncharacterized protein n=1 Tax=Pseudoneurospora amorphoporcata TaxID=241081 RepID=A0AAN6SDZ6_9PEZI|nr:hypothetical protein QBC32DRAFT_316812 [Pseudoneurospora amorphoporcata]
MSDSGDVMMEDPVYAQLFLDAQRFTGNIENPNPPEYSLPSTAYRNCDDLMITSDHEWPSSSEGRNSIQSLDGVRDLISENAGAYAMASSAPRSSIPQGHASATPRSSSSGSMAPLQSESSNQPSAPSPGRHQHEERHATEWSSVDRLFFEELHTGKHARKAMEKVRRKLCEKLGVEVKSWTLSKMLRKIKKRIIPQQREKETVDTLEPIFIEQIDKLELGPPQGQSGQMDEIMEDARAQLRREITDALQGFAFRMEAARVSQTLN